MSDSRQQIWIDAPPRVVWGLIGDVERHPEWWPRVLEVECEGLEAGCTYREVVQTPLGKARLEPEVERLDDCEELAIRCLTTGTFVRFALTEAQGGTFVDGRMGMDPLGIGNRVFDAVAGRRYFRAWLRDSLEALRGAATEGTGVRSPSGPRVPSR